MKKLLFALILILAAVLAGFSQKYITDKRFYCYIQVQLLKVTGKFSLFDYQKACYAYILENPRLITDAQRRFAGKKDDTRNKAIEFLIKDLYKYFGNQIKKIDIQDYY